jgi:hypothetical protein
MKIILVAVLALLIGWVYAPSLRGGFVYEDYKAVDACAVHAGESQPWLARLGLRERGLTRASWCWQQSAQAMRWTNLGLHLVVVGLVWRLAWALTGESVASMLAAAFFGLNAVAVESVAYLSSRGELIAAIGVLGACLAARHRQWVAVAPLLLLGWLGKETAVVGLLLVPLVARSWTGLAVGAAVLVAGILTKTALWWTYADMPGRLDWALVQGTALARLLVLSIVPVGQTVDYDYATVPAAMQGFACAMLLAGLVWAAMQRSRVLLMGAVWVLCAAAPRLLVPTPRSVFSEHQFYVPLVGVALMLASVFLEQQEAYGSRPLVTLD